MRKGTVISRSPTSITSDPLFAAVAKALQVSPHGSRPVGIASRHFGGRATDALVYMSDGRVIPHFTGLTPEEFETAITELERALKLRRMDRER